MRSSFLWLLPILAAAGACSGTPQHRIDSIHFSDSQAAPAKGKDPYVEKFELSTFRDLRVDVGVTYTPGLLTRSLNLACTLSGPGLPSPKKIERSEDLPTGGRSTSWIVTFESPEKVMWVAGKFHVSCETPVSSIAADFEIVGRSRLSKAIKPAVADDAGGNPENNWVADGTLRSDPNALLSPPIEPRIYATNTKFGTPSQEGDRFDAASVRWLTFEIDTEQIFEEGIPGCAFERISTGVQFSGAKDINATYKGTLEKVTVGSDSPGFWLPGDYRVICKTDKVRITPKAFTVVGRIPGKPGTVTRANQTPVPTGKVTGVKFYLGGATPPLPDDREYFTTLAGSAKYVWTELILESERPTEMIYTIDLRCYYFSDRGELLGKAEGNPVIPAAVRGRAISVGFGNAEGTFWRPGLYYSECDSKGSFLGSGFFEIRPTVQPLPNVQR